LLEKKKQKKNTSKTRNVKNSPVYSRIDDAINDAYLLSDLRKPSQIITKTDEDGQAQKKSRYKKLSPILFVKIQHSAGKKNKQTKNTLVKALVDTGASESIISLKAAKGLPLSSKTETKKWSTAAGLLMTSFKTSSVSKNRKVISRRGHRPQKLRNNNRSRPHNQSTIRHKR
jgi:hypothetical protein